VVMNAKKNVTKMVIVPKPVKHDASVIKVTSDKVVFASSVAQQHTHARKTNTGRNVVMNAKKSATKMVIVPQHVKNDANVTKDFSDRAVFASKGAEQHIHVLRMSIGRNVVTNAKRSVTKTVIVPKHANHVANVITAFSDKAVFASKAAEQHTVVAENQPSQPTMVVAMEEATVVTLNVPKMSIGRNVVMNAKKNVTTTDTVPKHANHDANVTKDFSERVALVLLDAQ